MSRHGYSHGTRSDFGSDLGSAVGGGLVVIAVFALYVLFRMVVYIVQTFMKYHNVAKALWYSLSIFGLLSILTGVLSALLVNKESFALAGSGFVQLFLTCVVVQRQHANSFMVEDVSIRDAILHRKWWADESTPLAA
jgi:hypothetical protein